MTDMVDKLMQAPMFERCDKMVLDDFLSTAHHRIRRREAGKQLTNKLTAFTAWLGEHIKLEDEILFPRAIAAEGMPTIE